MSGLIRTAILVLWTGALACEGNTAVTAKKELFRQDGGVPCATRKDPRLEVAHMGTRRIEFWPGSQAQVAFRERITTDGHSRYSIEPLEPLGSSIPDWDAFVLVQRVREGFLFRYRDFSVRDPELFAQNWITTDMGQSEPVAGRTCRRSHIERRDESTFSYELWTDLGTGLVLASRELDGDQVTASMTYERVDLDPDLADVVWHRPANKEEAFNASLSLASQLDAQILEPHLIPAGYALREAAAVEDGDVGRWLKLTYVDGIDSLFFLQRLPARHDGMEGLIKQHDDRDIDQATSSVQVFEVGSARVVQGMVEGFELMVIGKLRQAELLDMIESALP